MIEPQQLRLLLVTDPAFHAPDQGGLEAKVRAALAAGATAVQLRDKEMRTGSLLPLALRLKGLCREHGALFFVNDRVDLALAAGADGVHIGEDDLPISQVRAIAPGLLIGASADTPERARAAVQKGAHYIGCGAIWGTASKNDAGAPIGITQLTDVASSVPVPVVAIGGITPERAPELADSGIAGVAVIRGILARPDVTEAVHHFRKVFA